MLLKLMHLVLPCLAELLPDLGFHLLNHLDSLRLVLLSDFLSELLSFLLMQPVNLAPDDPLLLGHLLPELIQLILDLALESVCLLCNRVKCTQARLWYDLVLHLDERALDSFCDYLDNLGLQGIFQLVEPVVLFFLGDKSLAVLLVALLLVFHGFL